MGDQQPGFFVSSSRCAATAAGPSREGAAKWPQSLSQGPQVRSLRQVLPTAELAEAPPETRVRHRASPVLSLLRQEIHPSVQAHPPHAVVLGQTAGFITKSEKVSGLVVVFPG